MPKAPLIKILGVEKEVHKHDPAIGQYLQFMGRIKARYGIT